MKKTLLILLTCLFSSLASMAQDDPPLIENFEKAVRDVNTVVFNDNLNVMQIKRDDEQFELLGMDKNMNVKWSLTLDGVSLGVDKFHDKIVALAATEHTFSKGTNNTFKAFVVDPVTGKLLKDKVIYTGDPELSCTGVMSTGKGTFFKLAIRQTALKRNTREGKSIGAFFTTQNSFIRDFNTTKELQVIDLNENLDPVNSFKAVVSNGKFITAVWNTSGDMFACWFNGPSIEVYKYEAGKTTPSSQMTASISFEENNSLNVSDVMTFLPSEKRDIIYYGTMYRNADKDMELGIGKLDFGTNKKPYIYEVYDKDALKAIKKAFVPVNKKLDDVDLGNPKGFALKFMDEIDGKLLVGVSYKAFISSGYTGKTYTQEGALVLNGYNQDLRQVYQTVMPSGYTVPFVSLQYGRHIVKDKLYIVANNLTGLHTLKGMYGVLNLKTGDWEKMETLSKKHMDSSDFVDGSSIMWYGDGFVVPYFSFKAFSVKKFDLSLQQNSY